MSDIVLTTEQLGKRYRIGAAPRRRYRTFGETLAQSLSAPVRNLKRLRGLSAFANGEERDVVWALRDVSFELKQGEVLGVIGRNGAGKSTLLKVLSRITKPTTGSARVRGRVGALLEVGTGFHPELTGRDNVYLNGSILGMDRAYIDRRFDEIVEFAGVERFIDTPVKRYSSGMYLRLAFSVAAHLEPEVLIVDEVLAVGDAEFQKKCLGKMDNIAREGRTVLFVSHNMNAIQRLCTRSLLLCGGRMVAEGSTPQVVRQYLALGTDDAAPREWIDVSAASRRGNGGARVEQVWFDSGTDLTGHQPHTGGQLEFRLAIASDVPRVVQSLAVILYDLYGTKLINAHTGLRGVTVPLRAGRNVVTCRIGAVHLNPGVYVVGLWLADTVGQVYDSVDSAFRLEVVGVGDSALRPRGEGTVACDFEVLGID
jgi:lipopolysaccharide transport system ATP-binding protein